MKGNFHSAYDQGFARVAACTTTVHIGDPASNVAGIIDTCRELDSRDVAIAVFPELCLTGYAIDDLLLQDVVLDAVLDAIETLRQVSSDLFPVIIVGAPLRRGNRLYNCAVVVHRGRVLGVVPKSYLPNYREFYEKRHFASGVGTSGIIDLSGRQKSHLASTEVPFGPDQLFQASDLPDLTFHVEVCEDLWVPVTPSSQAALAGAVLEVNLSGSPITVGKSRQRHELCKVTSARNLQAYVYAAAGPGESSTDLSWDGQTMIYENGLLLSATDRFSPDPGYCLADVDLDLLRQERIRQGSFDDNALAQPQDKDWRVNTVTLDPTHDDIGLERPVNRFPFVPNEPDQLAQDCYEAYNIQVYGLRRRLESIGSPKVVIGVSGGLDSTHALLVAAKAMDQMGRPRTDILAYTMPGFATTDHTKNNALALCQALGIPCEVLDIRPAATQMLKGMGHPAGDGAEVYDVTFENVQAGLRYDYLFRIANQRGGIVLGTGDLSELALGWCTFGVGDQMSHYGVNTGVPKTLIQHLIRWCISSGQFNEAANGVLESVLETEISPELVPARPGEKIQSTQAKIGPYELQDFTLYHVLRHGMRPSRIVFLSHHAWRDASVGSWPPGFHDEDRHSYDLPAIKDWTRLFLRRFVGNQFKRSTLPNGPKVVAGGSLSPRGDWRMPSDALARAWIDDLETIPDERP
ncbi:NAD(+) synthase [Cutibacterium equinum]|uniref:Glutamine-dependent NAD(+) synthetase n=1 Tax=Cutibacterium equinum TaxID=3016342 RepID=A0ABY7QZW8_9ACTN|nr:NAD(+) synthase [Cutibacterium equinum]WCC79923.1 NAD(+) synthase [Cutibacterium equinum]